MVRVMQLLSGRVGISPRKGQETLHGCWKVPEWWLPSKTAQMEPCIFFGATYCILGVEDVRGRRIVHNDHFAQLPSKATQVFHVVPTMENTRFSEEPCPEHPPAV